MSALTDRPIFPGGVHAICTRQIAVGGWHVWYLGEFDRFEQCVVDDFGFLAVLPNEAHWQAIDFHDAGHIEDSVWAYREAQRLEAKRIERAEQDAATTRALLQPPRVTVEIIPEDGPDWWHPRTTVRITGEPPPLEAPGFVLEVRGCEPVNLSHAQMSALLLAAGELCKAVPRRAVSA